jgi:hypothetical protein
MIAFSRRMESRYLDCYERPRLLARGMTALFFHTVGFFQT